MPPFSKRHPRPDDTDTDDEDDDAIDPELRLRTVRTAASTIAESIRSEARAQKRKSAVRNKRSKSFFRGKSSEKKRPTTADTTKTVTEASGAAQVTGPRRNIYVNHPLSAMEVDPRGEPTARYVRNKVRTSKYTILTFLPKNLYEQFRRIANLYFLALVVLQVFSVFGAASAQIAMLPLVFILSVTAIKDGVEDYRRASLDEEVNTSAATKLGQWRNVNQPLDPRSWFEKLFGLNAPGKVTKGVRKLREKDAGEGMRVMLTKTGDDSRASNVSVPDFNDSTLSLSGPMGANGRRLEDIQSVDSHSYPPGKGSFSTAHAADSGQLSQFGSFDNFDQSPSRPTLGVINWRQRTSGSSRWERTLWKKLEVGDIVLLRDNEQVPADVVVLSTSDPEGMCYLETKNLDGETNLKPRKCCKATAKIQSEEDIERSSFVLDSEPPHQNLYTYHGVLRYEDPATGVQKQESIGINELLLRGCAVRNTSWIIGLVVFTGADTKIMLNGGETPSKRSKIEKETNFNVIVNFIILLLMCSIAAVFSGLFDDQTGTSAKFYEAGADPTSSPIVNALVTLASCLIAFQNIVPISLYISIEIVKTIQAYFISQDVDMYYEALDTPCAPKTWNISDDLGQIEYVFSDKTGTLTQNIMEFQKCSIHGVAYGEGVTEAQRGAATREGRADSMNPAELNRKLAQLKQDMLTTMERAFKNRYMQTEKLTLVSPKIADDLTDHSSEQRAHLIAFFRALALCHSVIADRPEPKTEPWRLEYKAESPDEAALVAAARDVGFPFLGKSKDGLEIEVMGQKERYTLLRLLEFNSTRKRMSAIVRNPEGKLILYCKGADSVIYERLARDHDPYIKEQTQKNMESFANNGLRTLCIAYRNLSEEEYLSWSRVYDAATSAVKDRDDEIDKANALIEHSLHILGATALEDKLQEGVPEAIELLHKAGIKLWILTGDKLQTAIEIGFSCNLLKNDMEIMILSADSSEGARAQIEAGLNKIASVLGPPTWDPRKRGFLPGAKASFAVVIDGDTLRYALTPELKPLFLNLGTQCETVVCCRVSPAQKALTVKLVKEGRNAMTLSIGDGANDVAMIQEANIGCGLFGLEGSQAAMSADYAFGQFRFLTKLLLVHGRWSYQRIADMHSNFFYKNVIWTFPLFWFLIFSSFDATYLYQYTFILLCSVVFTSLPVIALGAFDQDINAHAALAFPQLYVRGIRGLEYTRLKFWLYMLDGFYQSGVVFFIPYCAWTLGLAVSWNGKGIDSLADFGTTVAVAAIFAANTYVGINTHYWTFITWIVVIGSSLVMVAWIIIYSFFPSSDFVDEVTVLFGEMTFWATVVVSVFIALAPRFIIKFITSTYAPLDKDIVREMWVQGDLKDRLGIRHRRESKNKSGPSGVDLEYAPMFTQPHARSESEISTFQRDYEPAPTNSPGDGLTPPSTRTLGERTPSSSQTSFVPELDHNAQYVYAPDEDHVATPTAATSGRSFIVSPSPVSPHPSYYSASDIPAPSPIPPPVYRYPSGEITTQPPSRKSSFSRSIAQSSAPLSPPVPLRSPDTLQIPSPRSAGMPSSSHAGAYEMRVRSPPHSVSSQQQYYLPHDNDGMRSPPPDRHELSRGASEASYATAPEGWSSADDHGRTTPTQWRGGGYESDQETIAVGDRSSHHLGYDVDDDRPESALSWSGPHAI
ncbi:hypothetical protein PLICRDRAFT_115926 [Plicaturopsis crispa FD-325 SS-3]|nr:hypothetical protein PLICRDRAFT_115926 [Plicaturopsis crispa FD-325 SS-3]